MNQEVPREKAAEELARWEAALREQREAERQLEAARHSRVPVAIYPLHARWLALRDRADQLLARAVATRLGHYEFLDSE